MNFKLKDLPKIIKEYKAKGVEVERFSGLVNGRRAWCLDGSLFTDYEIVNGYGFY